MVSIMVKDERLAKEDHDQRPKRENGARYRYVRYFNYVLDNPCSRHFSILMQDHVQEGK
jgi:hypothetical protein